MTALRLKFGQIGQYHGCSGFGSSLQPPNAQSSHQTTFLPQEHRRNQRLKKSGESLLNSRQRLPEPAQGSCGLRNASAVCGGSAGDHHAGCGRDVATLLSLLAAANRKGHQQCYLPPGVRNQDLESFLVTLGQMHQFFAGPQVPATPRSHASQFAAPHSAVPASIPTTIFRG